MFLSGVAIGIGTSSHIEGLSAFLVPHSLWQLQWQSKHSSLNSLCGSHYSFLLGVTASLPLELLILRVQLYFPFHIFWGRKWIKLCLKNFNIDSSQKGSFCPTLVKLKNLFQSHIQLKFTKMYPSVVVCIKKINTQMQWMLKNKNMPLLHISSVPERDTSYRGPQEFSMCWTGCWEFCSWIDLVVLRRIISPYF